MITLDATTKSLEVVLGGAVQTSQLPVTAMYTDWNGTALTQSLAEVDTATTDATPVPVVPGPSAGVVRVVNYLSVYNKDTQAATVTVSVNNNGTRREEVKQALSPGQSLQYTRQGGWLTPGPFGVDLVSVAGTAPATGSGVLNAGTLRVVLATDQPALTNKLLVTPDSVALPAHQSVNVDEVNGVTPATGSGSLNTGTLRVVLATDQPALTNKLLVTPDSVALPAHQSVNLDEVNGVAPATGSGTLNTGTLRVVLATDQPALSNKLLVTPDSVALPAHQSVNLDEVNGVAPATGSGSLNAGTLRVVLATDQPALTNKLLVTPDSVALPAHQSVNLDQFNGVTPATGSGALNTGTLRVVLATDQPALTNKLLVTPDSVALPAHQSVNLDQWNGVAPTAAAALADGASNPTSPLFGACPHTWNGSTWDRLTGITRATGLAMATRTATASFNLTNPSARLLMVYVNVTSASGTGGLKMYIQGADNLGAVYSIAAATTPITSASSPLYIVSPYYVGSTATFVAQVFPTPVPRALTIQMAHLDASSYTYSVTVEFFP